MGLQQTRSCTCQTKLYNVYMHIAYTAPQEDGDTQLVLERMVQIGVWQVVMKSQKMVKLA